MIEQERISSEALAAEEAGKFHCPRCSKRLPRPDFIKHLWLEHHLVLDGRSVRDPWRLIEDWLEEYCQSAKPALLARCRAFAQRPISISTYGTKTKERYDSMDTAGLR